MEIRVFREVPPLRSYRHGLRDQKRSVGLVPTMGALHEGHLNLAREAARECLEVFMSIYVNPTQFGVSEDLDSYPRTWDTDMAKLRALNEELEASKIPGRVTAVFAPITKIMYPTLPPSSEVDGEGSFVTITPLGKMLEGASRPVFFRGVATVCMKLFNIVQADRLYFGQKDVQQTRVIKRLLADFFVDSELRVIPTTREADGLAMSSRNVYLGARRRLAAVALPDALRAAERQYVELGAVARDAILQSFRTTLDEGCTRSWNKPEAEQVRMGLDYVSLADPDTMEELDEVDPAKGAVLSAALKMLPIEVGEDECPGNGKIPVRLIDNLILPLKAS